jgi:hypothetical protein
LGAEEPSFLRRYFQSREEVVARHDDSRLLSNSRMNLLFRDDKEKDRQWKRFIKERKEPIFS